MLHHVLRLNLYMNIIIYTVHQQATEQFYCHRGYLLLRYCIISLL